MQVTPDDTDPLDNAWEALAQADYAPHGKPYDFRSRCPVHGGNNPDALHVSVGCDGSAVMWCFVCGVTGDAVMTALGRPVRGTISTGSPARTAVTSTGGEAK